MNNSGKVYTSLIDNDRTLQLNNWLINVHFNKFEINWNESMNIKLKKNQVMKFKQKKKKNCRIRKKKMRGIDV